jgi:peroxiredoxin
MPEQLAAPRAGDPAPRIQGEITGNGQFDLAEQRGTWVVVYFFPRANTPG